MSAASWFRRVHGSLETGSVAERRRHLRHTLSNPCFRTAVLSAADPSLAEIDRVAFGPAEGFATSAPAGASIVLKHPFLDNSQIVFPENPSDPAEWDASNWTVSSAAFGGGDKGTPGAKNDGYEEQEHPACYDANVCTWDSCDAGVCVNVPKPGCCTSNSMCNDGDVCTQDVCNLQTLTCTNDEIEFCCETVADCADDNPCNIEYCVQNRCRFSAYIVNPGCCYAPESGNPVTGLPWSSPDERVAFANAQCDDKKFCTPTSATWEPISAMLVRGRWLLQPPFGMRRRQRMYVRPVLESSVHQ